MPRMALKEEWQLLTAPYSADQLLKDQLWQEIEFAYTEPGRHYHSLRHLSKLLSLAASHRSSIVNLDSIRFAIFYHDIIYIPLRKDNEEKSAKLAVEKLRLLGLEEKQLQHIRQMILATKHHAPSPDPDLNLLLDLDLSILGQPWEVYSLYTEQIRKEYSIVPTFMYNMCRVKVLKHFLSLPAIFKTAAFHKQYEANAINNLERELLLLNC